MTEVMFVIKMIGLTILVVFVMQIKISDNTLEEYSLNWIHSSPAGEYLTGVAQGGVKLIRNGVQLISSKFSENKLVEKKENLPGYRQAKFALERSQASVSDKKVKEAIVDPVIDEVNDVSEDY